MVLMPLVTDTDGILRQNLVDAGCGPKTESVRIDTGTLPPQAGAAERASPE